ncbi:MAG: redoxin domain-containing protein [bacterium]|nr:redoxin domain-containing protein [bacterium]
MNWIQKNAWVAGVVAVLALGVYLNTQAGEEEYVPGPKPGEKAPLFSAETLAGDKIQLEKLQGKLVLVDFWATWCPPCKAEIPHLREAYKKFHDKGLEIISISNEKSKVISKFAEKNEMVWNHISDENGRIMRLYQIEGFPTPFLIGPDGKVLARDIPLRSKYLEPTLEKYIKLVEKDDASEKA